MPAFHTYEFASFVADAAKRELLLEGRALHVTPKEFDLLLLFVQNSGQVLTREELIEHLWPRTVVEDGNLTQLVSLLRKVLDEDVEARDSIKTLPRQGYLFSLPVQTRTLDAPARWSKRLLFGFAALIAVLGIAGLTIWGSRVVAPRPAAIRARVLLIPIQVQGGDEQLTAIARQITSDIAAALIQLKGTAVVRGEPEHSIGPLRAEQLAATYRARWIVSGSIQRQSRGLRITIEKWNPGDKAPDWVHHFEGDRSAEAGLVTRIRADVVRSFQPLDRR